MPTLTVPITDLPDGTRGPDLSGLGGTEPISYTLDPGGETYTVVMPDDWRHPDHPNPEEVRLNAVEPLVLPPPAGTPEGDVYATLRTRLEADLVRMREIASADAVVVEGDTLNEVRRSAQDAARFVQREAKDAARATLRTIRMVLRMLDSAD